MEAVPRPRHFYTEPERLDVGEVRVAYRRKGEGEPVLYLHGNGFTRMWLPFHDELAARMDLIAPEHPGYGETPMPDWLEGFDDLVLHYDEFLDVLGLETVHVVGYSLGGWIAAELAAFYPRRLRSLTLVCPAGLRVPGQPAPEPDRDDHRGGLGDAVQRPRSGGAGAARLRVDGGGRAPVRRGDDVRAAGLEPAVRPAARAPAAARRLPVAVIGAEHDRIVPDAVAERYAELLGARIERSTAPATRSRWRSPTRPWR